ncbi:hypothetical protein [Lignipirellula cremea]|uniref:hypothetical protein n=1 Tax=Lignipirellula cremea TaxID=2528010 RepID=UPI0011A2B655|nr:hypothetical protein [Lignipirellula cremea]
MKSDDPRLPLSHCLLAAAALLLIVLVAAAVRWPGLQESFWVDELHTVWCVVGEQADVVPRAQFGNQAPLYFLGERLLTQTAGVSEAIVRMPSLIASVALCPLLFWLVWLWTRSLTGGLLAAALAAVDSDLIFYGSEARPYACLQAVAVVHLLLLTRLLDRPPTQAARLALHAGFVLVGVLAFYLHYTAALLFLAEAVAILGILAWRRNGASLPGLVVDLLAIGLAGLFSLRPLRFILERRDNWSQFIPEPSFWQMFQKMHLAEYLVLPLAVAGGWAAVVGWRRFGESSSASDDGRADEPLSFSPGRFDGDSGYSNGSETGWILGGCWLGIPLVVAWLASHYGVAPVFYHRYLLAEFPAAIALAGVACGASRRRSFRLALAVGVLTLAVLTGPTLSQLIRTGEFTAPRNENWRRALVALNDVRPPGAPIVLYSNLIETSALAKPQAARSSLLRDYSVLPLQSAYPLRGKPLLISLAAQQLQELSAEERSTLAKSDEFWLVVRGDWESAYGVCQALLAQLPPPSEGYELSRYNFGQVWAIQIQPR